MQGFTAGILILAAAVPAVGQKRDPKLEPYTSETGQYRVAFPGEPKSDSKEIATPAGAVKMTTERAESGRDLVLAVTVATYPEGFKDLDPKTVLNGVRDGLKGVDGVVKSDGDVAIESRVITSGREFRVEAGRNVVRCRAFLVGHRLYQVMASGKKEAVDSRTADTFLKSFELLPEK